MTHDLDETLRWYWQGRFTAADVTRATGLTERAQRELLKIGVIQAVPQAKTKTRLLNSRMLKRVAIIAPLNSCGLSLAVSGQIVFAAPNVDDFLFDIIDPIGNLLDPIGPRDPITNMPLRKRANPDPHGVFDPAKPAVAEPEWDLSIEVLNNRYVAVQTMDGPGVFGELSADKTAFYWWENAVMTATSNPGTPDEKELGAKFEYDRSMSDDLLAFNIKGTTPEEEQEAEFAAANPVTKVSVNVSLALKIALRRLMYIDPADDSY